MSDAGRQHPGKSEWRLRLLELPRLNKRIILVSLDFVLLTLALWIALSIRYNTAFIPFDWRMGLILISGPFITVATFAASGLYRFVTRYVGYRGHTRIIGCIWLSVLIWSLVVFMSGQLGVPRSVVLGYGLLATLLIAGSREVAAMILESAGVRLAELPLSVDRKPVIIFGAGQLGVQLLEALRRGNHRDVVAFIDTEPSLWRQYIGGVKVHRPDRLANLIERYQVKEILVAFADDRRRERRRILKDLQSHPVEVLILPGVDDVTSGRVSMTDLRPVEVNDLLGRDKVPAHAELLKRKTLGKSVLVTGAGGSIGSELVRQILRNGPRRIVLLDISEVALYRIEDEISEAVRQLRPDLPRPEIVGVLGSVLDAVQLREAIAGNEIEVIYHAAAYKHVPIVEQNPIFGLRNNTLGTATVVECAKAAGVELVVLISTDKAVRPTNVMGASKRLAELVLQAAAANGGPTIFTMVRFGNVLDSSGSVVQKFRRQIRAGGPVTVTHPEIIRYFMSIPEAAELVIQAGAMAQGGDVFVLDMGEPVRIDDLARVMVRLSGFDVRGAENPDGDIAITYTGLRSGEKLYEELLIGANTKATEHPRIWRSDEPFLPAEELEKELDILEVAMNQRDYPGIHAVLLRTVEGYQTKVAVTTTTDEVPSASWTPPARTLH
ncbi:MAG: nucleoside-diphosphate sugar epimerase/dehydratase [Hyphomicrobium sp.]|jgi:FlaA1/EpsC-like NDP-sugar epimerase